MSETRQPFLLPNNFGYEMQIFEETKATKRNT